MLMPGARAESDTLVVYFSMPEDVDAVAGAQRQMIDWANNL